MAFRRWGSGAEESVEGEACRALVVCEEVKGVRGWYIVSRVEGAVLACGRSRRDEIAQLEGQGVEVS